MPTISQLPPATIVSESDSIPLNQSGTLKSVSIGNILQSVQPAIVIETQSLVGRTSLGTGYPEQVGVGNGLAISGSTLSATGLDHASYPVAPSFDPNIDLVASRRGMPQLLPAIYLRSLFSAGSNISIDSAGVISTSGLTGTNTSISMSDLISAQSTTSKASAADVIPINQSGVARSITYANFIDGLTIDQAQSAAAAADTDTFWVAQGTSVMERQNFSAVWSWITNKLGTYMVPSVEIVSNIQLQPSIHNGTTLVCSHPIVISLASALPNGFHCRVVNVSSGNVSFGAGITTSTGTNTLAAGQSADINGIVYSGGSIAYVSVFLQGSITNSPGAVGNLTATATSSSTISVSWQPPANTSGSIAYTAQYRITGSTTWSLGVTGQSGTNCIISGLNPATAYDVVVQAVSSSGIGPYSNILSVTTMNTVQASAPAQIVGLAASSVSSTSVVVSWTAQSGTNAATSYTVQYRVSGGQSWTWSVSGLTNNSATISSLQPNTSYEFAVVGLNAVGYGVVSSILTVTTPAASNAVSSITWNVPPAGPYAKGIGAIGVNAHVTPATAAIQFGASQSASSPPTSWTTAVNVNSDLWGAYVPTPSASGTWYMWVEGTDGSALTVYSIPFVVQ